MEHTRDSTDRFRPRFDAAGLVTAIVVGADTRALLMVAHMNAEAIERTRATGQAHFWSRSRRALWRKGETSGNGLNVAEMRVDCDQDALLLVVHPARSEERRKGKSVSVRVDLGGRRIIKQTSTQKKQK